MERGIHAYPDLCIGMRTEGHDVRSVGNSAMLQESAFVEAFNLKAAIEYNLKNFKNAKEALTDMPPRKEDELDPVTLHNVALINIESDQSVGFDKLQHLIKSAVANLEDPDETGQESSMNFSLKPPATAFGNRPTTGMAVFSDRLATAAVNQDITETNPMDPPEVLANMILLLIKYEDMQLAADTLNDYREWAEKYMDVEILEFIDAVLLSQDAPLDAAEKLSKIVEDRTVTLRSLMKKLSKMSKTDPNKSEEYGKCLKEYEAYLQEKYLPVIMAQAKIYWDKSEFQTVERLFRKCDEFCRDLTEYVINYAHTIFVQNNKFTDASTYYEAVVSRVVSESGGSILNVEAVVLANLCVCYIMTSRNEQAESLMREIEKEEEQLAYNEPDRKLYHLCIVDLIIGTLYCSKGNFEFGLSRVIKSLEPYNKKLGPDTWHYCKICFLSLVELLMQELLVVPDDTIKDTIDFLTNMEEHGRNIIAREGNYNQNEEMDPTNTISWEARQIKSLLISKTGWP